MADEDDIETGNPRDKLRQQSAHYLVLPDLVTHFAEYATGAFARVIAELNNMYPGGLGKAKEKALEELKKANVDADRITRAAASKSKLNLFVALTRDELMTLDRLRRETKSTHFPIYKVWADPKLRPFAGKPLRTIKADACLATFGSHGRDIVVAVADSGIDGDHEHFKKFANLEKLPDGLEHCDFTDDAAEDGASALVDEYGHGTHVAGIIAGCFSAKKEGAVTVLREQHVVDEEAPGDEGGTITVPRDNTEPVELRGVAPEAKLLSLKVLDGDGSGHASNLIAALEHVFDLNDSGRKTKVHCLNLSLGYPFEAEWYAAGQSPLCVAVTRLVRSGVVVVAAAGNDGSIKMQFGGSTREKRIGLAQSINDPGNAEAAITVGSTHGESPHLYGVSYFSSRGPTADGRMKPDLLAPGERILSCTPRAVAERILAKNNVDGWNRASACYREDTGTSMAAPHVAGAVAAFLSVQNEFIGRPDEVKRVFMSTCTDLGRTREFQGAGLIDMMRAIQSV
ncbi:S8 family peptidase [Novosphingobium sp.]|uniref:S8 family peptidase n=1 Tax=Novosphingobium sp. TaxID=1874826 RepID=UPI00262F18EA|nr:S8 family peptidase [Novosphingobium sp.]